MGETKQKTIGQILFMEGPDDISGFYSPDAEGQNYRPYREIRKANSIQKVAKEIHALKLLNTTKGAIRKSTAYALENVLKNLLDPERLTKALVQQIEENAGSISGSKLNMHIGFRDKVDKTASEFKALAREWREYIGNVTLDVFFEVALERDSVLFFQETREVIVLSGVYINHPQAEAEEQQVLKRGVTPHKLLSFIDYFSRASHATKKDQMTRIRKFLKMVLAGSGRMLIQDRRNKPLANYPVGISNWSKEARYKLACALVANGMYEECLDYNLPESYKPLLCKFLGGFQETDDGLVKLPAPDRSLTAGRGPLSWEDALHKACENKEWGHLLGVLIRIGIKHGRIKAGSPFAFMEDFSKELGQAQYGPAIQANNLVLHFVNPPCMARN